MAKKDREGVWRERLARFAKSETTVAAFCRAEGVSDASLYTWRRRLAVKAPAPPPTVELVELERPVPTSARCIELAIDGVVVRLPVGFDEDDFRVVVSVLRETP
jgi:transposase-like protein